MLEVATLTNGFLPPSLGVWNKKIVFLDFKGGEGGGGHKAETRIPFSNIFYHDKSENGIHF